MVKKILILTLFCLTAITSFSQEGRSVVFNRTTEFTNGVSVGSNGTLWDSIKVENDSVYFYTGGNEYNLTSTSVETADSTYKYIVGEDSIYTAKLIADNIETTSGTSSAASLDYLESDTTYLTGSVIIPYDSIAYTATVNIDFTDGSMKRKIVVTGDCTINITALPEGGVATLKVIEDGTGGYAITLNVTAGSDQKEFQSSSTFSTDAESSNIIQLEYDGYEVVYGINTAL